MSRITMRDRADRRALINAEQASANRVENVHFRGRMIDLKVVRIPIDLPIYRMKNGRAQVEQYQYVEEHRLPSDFFEIGEENITAQQAQHTIVLEMSRDEKANIYDELERVSTQRETLLITADGVVLNGNRRLAAMRDLYAKDPARYASFSHVAAKVLPPEATEKDLELLEAELQMAPETKLEYGWVERRLKIRRHVEELKIPRVQIKDTYRFRREEDINVELQQLELAEEFLEKYLGRPRAYREVAKSEQLFKDLQKALGGKTGDDAEIRRHLGFILAKEAGRLGDRVYRFNPIFGKDYERVLTEFARNEGVALNPGSEGDTDSEDSDDPLIGLPGQRRSLFIALKPFFVDPSKSQKIAEKLAKTFDSIQLDKQEEDIRQAALRAVEQANRALNDIDLTVCDSATFPQIRGQLEAIIATATALKEQIERSSGSKPDKPLKK